MKKSAELADRLRQSIQGCAVHIHGPVQAWAAVEEAGDAVEVARHAMGACDARIKALLKEGAAPHDTRIKKEELTRAFLERLLRS
jgi:hypothetical protein